MRVADPVAGEIPSVPGLKVGKVDVLPLEFVVDDGKMDELEIASVLLPEGAASVETSAVPVEDDARPVPAKGTV